MIKHIVFWNIAGEESVKAKNIEILKSMLEELRDKIAVIKDFEVGLDFNRADTAFDVALYSSFGSKEDLDTYQVHPEHLKVVEFVKSVATKRAVVDYQI